MSRFYDGAETIATATPVQIAAGQIATVNFRLSGAGWIEGVVRNRQGLPLVDIDLDLYLLPGGERAGQTTRTKLDGTFLFGPLLPGSYVLRCDPDALQGYARTYFPSTFFRPSSQPIAVSIGQGTKADFVLEAAGAISGQITDLGSSTGVAGIDLDLFDATGQEWDVTASSDVAGNYLLGPVPPGSYYLRADPGALEGRLPQYFAGATNILNATVVSVTAGKTSADVNFALAPAGWISGLVKNSAGVALPGIDLDLYLAETGERVLIGALTDTNGTFQLGPIAPTKYVVRCDPDILDGYAVEYYSGKPNKAVANAIAVHAFTGTPNIDFTLDPAGSISGRIVAADTRQWGACWLGCQLWEQLGLGEFWRDKLTPGREGTRWDQVLQTRVLYRLIDPGSEWRLHRHWFEHTAIADLRGGDFALAEIHRLYECHDKLVAHKAALFDHLTARWRDLFAAKFEVLLYDLTRPVR